MDFSAWSPSHTLLLVVTLLAIGAQLIAILTSLKINAKRLEDSVDKIDTKIDVVQSEIKKEIRDVREKLRKKISGIREELRGEIQVFEAKSPTSARNSEVRFKVSGAKSPMSEPN